MIIFALRADHNLEVATYTCFTVFQILYIRLILTVLNAIQTLKPLTLKEV